MTTLLDLKKICEAAKPDELRNREDIIKLFCVNGCDTEEAEFIATFHPIRTAEMIELLMEAKKLVKFYKEHSVVYSESTGIGYLQPTPEEDEWLSKLAAFEGATPGEDETNE